MGADLAPGSAIADRYVLEATLGQGGMGVVWAARSLETDALVAIKLMKARDEDPKSRRRFLREARAAASLQHPNVVRVLEVLELADGQPAIVMERLTGEPLSVRIAQGPLLSVADAARILLPVVSAVGMAHELGIVHRDLKPENIFLSRGDDGAEVVKVLDFGIAKVHAEDGGSQMIGATTTGALLGTPSYMSPEQVFGERDIDFRADVWSLGMILYECLSGVLPTQAENVGQILKLILTRDDWHFEEVAPDAPDDLKALVSQCLRRNRLDRPDLTEISRVLRAHTDTLVPSFGSPAIRAQSDFPSKDTPIDRLALGLAETVRSNPAGDRRASTNGATTASTGPREGRNRWPITVAIAIVGVLGVGIWRASLQPEPGSAEPSAAGSAPSALAAPLPEPQPNLAAAPPHLPAPTQANPDAGSARALPREPAPTVTRAVVGASPKAPHASVEPAPAASAPTSAAPVPRPVDSDPLGDQH